MLLNHIWTLCKWMLPIALLNTNYEHATVTRTVLNMLQCYCYIIFAMFLYMTGWTLIRNLEIEAIKSPSIMCNSILNVVWEYVRVAVWVYVYFTVLCTTCMSLYTMLSVWSIVYNIPTFKWIYRTSCYGIVGLIDSSYVHNFSLMMCLLLWSQCVGMGGNGLVAGC